jgi:hypothetical protein
MNIFFVKLYFKKMQSLKIWIKEYIFGMFLVSSTLPTDFDLMLRSTGNTYP